MQKSHQSLPTRDTENLILRAAEREFLTKGFAGARTTSIAEAAGVTHAMLHYYFRTKEKLFDKIISEKTDVLKEIMFNPVEDDNIPLEDLLHKIIDKHLDLIAANPDLPRFLVGEIFSNPRLAAYFLEKLHAYGPPMIAALQKKIDSEAEKGNCRKVDAKMLMLDIASLNIFSYMASPAVNAVFGECMADSAGFLAMRKKENFDTVLRKIKP